jgi:hypothetical protein
VALKVDNREVMEQIAKTIGLHPKLLWLENNHVWSRTQNYGLRSHCACDTPFWREETAKALTRKLLLKNML